MVPVEEVIGTVLEALRLSGCACRERGRARPEPAGEHRGIADRRPQLRRAAAAVDEQTDGGQLEAYLERTWLVNDTDDWESDTDKVTLMTLHAAKGLEFPVVYIVAVEDGVLPHERVGRHPDELEEERRLAFVGITRAKDELQMSYAVTRDFRGVRRRTIPSSFLMEMPREELAMVDEAGVFDHGHETWDDHDHVDEAHDADDVAGEWQIESVIVEQPESGGGAAFGVAAATITTAAALAEEALADSTADKLPRVSPDVFQQGMTVLHPEYGPGQNRRAGRIGEKPPSNSSIRHGRPEEDHPHP